MFAWVFFLKAHVFPQSVQLDEWISQFSQWMSTYYFCIFLEFLFPMQDVEMTGKTGGKSEKDRVVWCINDIECSKFKYESAWTIQRQIDVTKAKIRWGTKLYFHFSSTFCCQHSPGAAEPWSESPCREGDAEAQRSFRWLTIPTAGAVRAVFRTLTGLRVGWLPNITPPGDIKSLFPNMEVCSLKRKKLNGNHFDTHHPTCMETLISLQLFLETKPG